MGYFFDFKDPLYSLITHYMPSLRSHESSVSLYVDVSGGPLDFLPFVYPSLFCGGFSAWLLPCIKAYGYGVAFNSFPYLDGFIHPLFPVWHSGRIFVFSQVLFFLRSAILLLRPNHIMKCIHGLLHDSLHPMELDSFVTLVYQDLIVVLSDVNNYNCPLYTVI